MSQPNSPVAHTSSSNSFASTDSARASGLYFFPESTETGRLCREIHWASTPFGPTKEWPPSLKAAVGTVLRQGMPQSLCWGPDLRQIYNDAYRAIMGDKHPAGLGQPVLENWREVAANIEPLFMRVLAGETVYFEDLPLSVYRNGAMQDVHFTFSYSPVLTDAGTIGGALINCFETTDQVIGRQAQAERDRLQSAIEIERARLHAAFQQSPSFLAILRGPTNVFESVNAAYEQIIGHGREVVGKPLFEAMPETRGQGFDGYLKHVRETGEPLVFRDLPVMLERSQGAPLEERYVDITYLPLVEADGRHEAVIAHGTDVTEQVLARRDLDQRNQQLQDQAAELEVQAEELQLSREELAERTMAAETAQRDAEAAAAALVVNATRYRTLAASVPVQVWTATPDGYLDFVNERAVKYFGVPEAQLLGAGWTAFLHPADVPTATARWSAALASGSAYEVEFRLRDGATGEHRWHLARALPERDADGAVVGWVGSNTDVETERRARAEAEDANRSKSVFLATMSHELRTPLNAIGGYTELLTMGLRGTLSEAQQKDMERIRHANQHLMALVTDILNFARLEAGQVEFRLTDVELGTIIPDIESLVRPQLEAKGLAFDHDGCAPDTSDRPHVVRADPEKLRQVLLNLLTNAVKFTDEGRVSLSCDNDESSGLVRILVSDTGRGIPADQLDRIFEPFVQVDRHRNLSSQQGVGLGLAISRDLARAMAGDLTIDSAVGVGSTFTLTLPVGTDQEPIG